MCAAGHFLPAVEHVTSVNEALSFVAEALAAPRGPHQNPQGESVQIRAVLQAGKAFLAKGSDENKERLALALGKLAVANIRTRRQGAGNKQKRRRVGEGEGDQDLVLPALPVAHAAHAASAASAASAAPAFPAPSPALVPAPMRDDELAFFLSEAGELMLLPALAPGDAGVVDGEVEESGGFLAGVGGA